MAFAVAALPLANHLQQVSALLNDCALLHPFALPDFRIGSLDALVVLSDSLAKLDPAAELVVHKLAENLKSLLNGDIDQWHSMLAVNDKQIDLYLSQFQWNAMKYRSDKSLQELTDMINTEVNNIDSLMKQKMSSYTQVRSQLQALYRKQSGNLTVRNLNDLVKKEHFVLDSEYLTTLLVAVPRSMEKDWLSSYETLTQMVVPRSTQRITEDDEYALYNVTLFQRVADEFTVKCRERKFVVRDFKWDEERMKEERRIFKDTDAGEKELWSTVLRLCKTNFGEVFACWIHIKALRVYVESVLRYGLPPAFQPLFIKAKPKQDQKVKDLISNHYNKLMGTGKSLDDQHIDESLQVLLGEKEYMPIVFFKINLF